MALSADGTRRRVECFVIRKALADEMQSCRREDEDQPVMARHLGIVEPVMMECEEARGRRKSIGSENF